MLSFGSVQLIKLTIVDQCIHIGWNALHCFNSNAGFVCLKKNLLCSLLTQSTFVGVVHLPKTP